VTVLTQQNAPSIVVSEVFGPTLQGEGRNLGQRAAFVRLGGCNLHCSWCDTPYTWDASRFDLHKEMRRVPVSTVVTQVAAMNPNVVVVTGGEPLLWRGHAGWDALIPELAAIGPVEVETNGTQFPGAEQVACYNVSPKLAHAGDPEERRINRDVLSAFAELAHAGRAILKVVVTNPEDVRAGAQLARETSWPMSTVYVMPEGTSPLMLALRHAMVANAVLDEGVNMTTRLHVLCWNTERGR
jgi:organic radical activating enzyme